MLGDLRHKRGADCPGAERQAEGSRDKRSLVVVSAVVGSFDVNPTNSFDSFSLLVLIQMMRSACCTPCSLQQGIVRTSTIVGLIQ